MLPAAKQEIEELLRPAGPKATTVLLDRLFQIFPMPDEETLEIWVEILSVNFDAASLARAIDEVILRHRWASPPKPGDIAFAIENDAQRNRLLALRNKIDAAAASIEREKRKLEEWRDKLAKDLARLDDADAALAEARSGIGIDGRRISPLIDLVEYDSTETVAGWVRAWRAGEAWAVQTAAILRFVARGDALVQRYPHAIALDALRDAVALFENDPEAGNAALIAAAKAAEPIGDPDPYADELEIEWNSVSRRLLRGKRLHPPQEPEEASESEVRRPALKVVSGRGGG